ncbi:hypothetical protein V1525DRAFT_387647 [Lipomyces kononenkoae]|uniref:Uncharacterized protein n=1 Tax=Lipomyces kononenkoae TaxID=34357 RepID=A0ACC3T466_LIPKO
MSHEAGNLGGSGYMLLVIKWYQLLDHSLEFFVLESHIPAQTSLQLLFYPLHLMSTINIVNYYFYKGMLREDPTRLQSLISLAYQTARDRQLYRRLFSSGESQHSQILRNVSISESLEHPTTSREGRHERDPLGWHVTLCFKDEAHLSSGTHIASHGYVKGRGDLTFVQATHAGEKPDSHLRIRGKPVWPSEEELEVAPEIAYGHFPIPGSS